MQKNATTIAITIIVSIAVATVLIVLIVAIRDWSLEQERTEQTRREACARIEDEPTLALCVNG